MARRRRGYQEGIDIPNTLGTPLLQWSDPTPTPTKSFDLRVPNTGAQRDYGATGAYVDTVPHRWKVGQPTLTGKQAGQLVQSRAQDRASAADLGISPREVRARRRTARAMDARDAGLARDRAIAMRFPPSGPATGGAPPPPTSFPSPTGPGTPPSGPTTGGVPAPPGFPAPSPASVRTGRPVPTPPPSGGAPTAPTGTPPLDMPPMPPRRAGDAPWMTEEPDTSTAGDPFIEGVRRAPDTPMPSSVEWRDDPDMPSLGLPGGTGDRALEDWLRGGGDGSSRTSASKPPSSRTQRRPRRPNA